MAVSIEHYLVLAAILFAVGAVGVVIRRNAIIILMSIELMLNAVNLTFIAGARYVGGAEGHVMAIFVMAVAAAEAAVGLALIISVFRTRETVNVDQLDLLKG